MSLPVCHPRTWLAPHHQNVHLYFQSSNGLQHHVPSNQPFYQSGGTGVCRFISVDASSIRTERITEFGIITTCLCPQLHTEHGPDVHLSFTNLHGFFHGCIRFRFPSPAPGNKVQITAIGLPSVHPRIFHCPNMPYHVQQSPAISFGTLIAPPELISLVMACKPLTIPNK